jgi:hypothetical protein
MHMDATIPSRPGPGRLLFRFGLGVATLARERIDAVLAASGGASSGEVTTIEDEVSHEEDSIDPKHLALGLLVGVAGHRFHFQAPARVRARWMGLRASARRFAAPFARIGALIGWLPGVPRAAAELRFWRARRESQLMRWTALGRREESEGRAVARAALISLRETALARVAESPDLQRVIHQQSEGVAVSAVGELRERSARADDVAEGAVGRLFGRGRARRSR